MVTMPTTRKPRKTARGGSRPGAGRKAGPGGKMIMMQLKAPPDLKAEFLAWCARRDISYSQALRRAMRDMLRGSYVPALTATDDVESD